MAIDEKCEDVEIKSPIVGIFYEGHMLQNPPVPYVKIGSHVGSKTVVCQVAAMMVPISVEAEISVWNN